MEKPITATDVIKRIEELRRQRAEIQTTWDRMVWNFIVPALNRELTILKKHGLYPEKPAR